MMELLAEQLGIPSAERELFAQFARLGETPPSDVVVPAVARIASETLAASRSLSNLPRSMTSFIGRETERLAVRSLLWRIDVRIVTLTGAGGSGKTRLALKVAEDVLDDFKDGVCFVPLSPVTQPSMVPFAIARALGIHDSTGRNVTGGIKAYLHSRHMLLLLDNFEQVVEAGSLIADLLQNSLSLKVLVTSREPLHLYGEQEFPVPPLAVPNSQEIAQTDAISSYESVALFVRRAQAANPEFTLTPGNRRAIAEICVRLNGLPLAIELLASRIRVLTPQAMLARMDDMLGLLKGGPCDVPDRQQSLRGSINWSYQLLTGEEKYTLLGIAVFAGSCTLDAAGSICGGHETTAETLDLLESLVNKNLLAVVDGPSGEVRFLMTDTIREFARERLFESGQSADVFARFTRYYIELAELAESRNSTPEYALMVDHLETEHYNLLAAIQWCLEDGDIETGLRFGAALTRFWYVRGYTDEAFDILALLAHEARQLRPSNERIKAYAAAGEAALDQDRAAVAHSFFELALADARYLGDTSMIGVSLIDLGCSLYSEGDYERGRTCLEEALGILREIHDIGHMAVTLMHLGEIARCQGDIYRARSLYAKAIQAYRERESNSGLAFCLLKFGNLEFLACKPDVAEELFREGLALSAKLKYKLGIAGCLAGLAGVAAVRQSSEIERAAVLFGASEAIVERSHLRMSSHDRLEYGTCISVARGRVDPELWEGTWAAGRAMEVDEAIAYALEVQASRSVD